MTAKAESAERRPPTLDEMKSLTLVLRDILRQAKARHRQLAANSDHGRRSVLFTLAQTGPQRVSALAARAELDLSTVSRHLRALEDEGYVEKTADPDDKRAFFVRLSPKGEAVIEATFLERINEISNGIGHWDAADVRDLTNLLTRFVSDTKGCNI